MIKRIYIWIGALVCLVACRPVNPSSYRGMPKEYKTAYQQIYGHCYDSLPDLAVVSLDLYSEGLELNKDKRIVGTGYNLFLSDIFVPDSLLEEGEYYSLPSDSVPKSFTFLRGRNYEGTPHGMYILNIENDKVIHIQVLDSGRFVYSNDSLLFTLYYRNIYGGKVTYSCSYTGPLIPWLKR